MNRLLAHALGLGTGHFLPLVPFARADEAAGHVVAFGGQEALLTNVELEAEIAALPGPEHGVRPLERLVA